MSWDKTILDASFKGVIFPVISTDDDIERSFVLHEYPYVDGSSVEDTGRSGKRTQMLAVFYGDDYEIQLQTLLNVLDQPGSGTLVHPIFGPMQAQFVRAHIPHKGNEPDQTYVPLDFIEDNLRAPLFSRVLPVQKAEKINAAADNALAAARAGVGVDIKNALNLPALLRSKLSADMLGVMGKMQDYTSQLVEARGWLSSGLYYLDNPLAFADDVASGMVSRVTALYSSLDLQSGYSGSSAGAGYDRGSLGTVWRAPVANLQQPFFTVADTPTQPSALTSDASAVQPFLVTHVTVQQSVAIAGAAAQLFSAAADTPVLTPADIETVAADARTALNTAIALVRLIYPDILRSRPITEPLKDIALAVTDTAEALIRAKPPLRDRVVDSAGNLQLIAHLWYGDYHRADELLRLNPQVRNPNFIARGTSLRAYAQ